MLRSLPGRVMNGFDGNSGGFGKTCCTHIRHMGLDDLMENDDNIRLSPIMTDKYK